MSDDRTKPRMTVTRGEPGSTTATYEAGIDFTDRGPDGSEGYRVTVGWSDEDESWLAMLTPFRSEYTSAMGDGATREDALCHLACSLTALVDALTDELQESRAEAHRLQCENEHEYRRNTGLRNQQDALRAENEKLRALLADKLLWETHHAGARTFHKYSVDGVTWHRSARKAINHALAPTPDVAPLASSHPPSPP